MSKYVWHPFHKDVYDMMNQVEAELIFREEIDNILKRFKLNCRDLIVEIKIGIRNYAWSTQVEDDPNIFLISLVKHYEFLDPIKYSIARSKIMSNILALKENR